MQKEIFVNKAEDHPEPLDTRWSFIYLSFRYKNFPKLLFISGEIHYLI